MTKIIIIDTNILVRYALKDDERQSLIAHHYINNAEYRCIIPIQVFCELDWVLRKKVKAQRSDVVSFFENLSHRSNVSLDKEPFDVGMYFLKNGGDFADGVIAYQTQVHDDAKWLTFDKTAQKIAKNLMINVQNP